jgi:hypothetical protein
LQEKVQFIAQTMGTLPGCFSLRKLKNGDGAVTFFLLGLSGCEWLGRLDTGKRLQLLLQKNAHLVR